MTEGKDKELTKYPELAEKGFNEEEIGTLTKWIDEGKPGLAKNRAERFGDIYVLGYSCEEIHRWFPEYPYESLLFARAQYDWDKLRDQYRNEIQKDVMARAMSCQMESVKFLSEIISATHIKWRKQILNYIANPEREKPPECLPNSIGGYGKVVSLLQDILNPQRKDGGGAKGGMGSPLVSITVKQDDGKPDIVISESTQEDVKRALLEET